MRNSLLNLFVPSNKINSVDLYNLIDDITHWKNSGQYSDVSNLPEAISFNSQFWEKINQIHRHTEKDGHERAVSLWWVDGDYLLTPNLRGSEDKVNIPAQTLSVKYEPTAKRDYALKRVECNNKELLKRTVSWSKVPAEGKVKISSLFNIHTHPVFDNGEYGWFSYVDIDSFINQTAGITCMVSDCLWLLIKTKSFPRRVSLSSLGFDQQKQPTPNQVRDRLFCRIYRADFGKKAITYLG